MAPARDEQAEEVAAEHALGERELSRSDGEVDLVRDAESSSAIW